MQLAEDDHVDQGGVSWRESVGSLEELGGPAKENTAHSTNGCICASPVWELGLSPGVVGGLSSFLRLAARALPALALRLGLSQGSGLTCSQSKSAIGRDIFWRVLKAAVM